MPRTRLYIGGQYGPDSEVELDADRSRYLTRVLRLRGGDSLHVFNGEGSEFQATMISAGKSSATLRIHEQTVANSESRLRVHLVQGISRGERMDFVVQKATELGVKRITPVITEYGVVKLDEKRAEKRRDHWQKVAAGACEQSGRVRLPLVDAPVALKDWFGAATANADCQLILKPGAETPLSAATAPSRKICILIGPEGGFSDSEYEDADIAGFRPVAMGPRILRTETAAVAAIAILQSLWGDLGTSGL